jgi:hypothetical protein
MAPDASREAGLGARRSRHASPTTEPVSVPDVQLGRTKRGGLAPAIMAIVEHEVRSHPELAQGIEAEVQLEFEEGYPPVRVVFEHRLVLVEDGQAVAPDLRVAGALPDLIGLMVTPLLGGLPSPINARGRAALGMVVLRRVRFEGRLALMRQLIRVIRV